MNKNHYQTTIRPNQSGLVSIVVTIIIMTVLTLITLGFSQIMRREQSQTLDRQLSTQAYYAAESGINDTIKLFQAGTPPAITDKNTCINLTGDLVTGDTNVSYKCILIDQEPNNLDFTSVGTDQSIITKLKSTTADIDSVVVSWQGDSATQVPRVGSSTVFPTVANWGGNTIGVLRISIYPIPVAGATRDTLNGLARTYFLYPNDTGGPGKVKYDTTAPDAADGSIVSDDCRRSGPNQGPYLCNAIIDLKKLVSPGASYYVRIKSIYSKTNVNLTAYDQTNKQLNLTGAQIGIDSTGATSNVKRRINVRMSEIAQYNWPEFAIESTDSLCKMLQTAPGTTTSGDPACPIN